MNGKKDDCPIINNSGQHKYFIYKHAEVFEPSTSIKGPVIGLDGKQLYEKVEYAILGCNCGSVIRSEVQGK